MSTDRTVEGVDALASVVVFTGGDPVGPAGPIDLPDDAFVIAADSGLHHAVALRRRVDLAIGDFDSVDPDALAAAESHGAVIERHPAAKDHTDLELALDRAVALGAARIIVVGGHGGRLDHFLANLLVLASPRYAAHAIEAHIGPATVRTVRRRVELTGQPDDVVTILPVHGAAHGVTTEGLLYPLRGETLTAGSTRGVSNALVGTRAAVALESGVVITIQPGGPGAHLDLVVKGAEA